MLRILTLFVLTALAEILGCHLPTRVLREQRPGWLPLPAALSLGLFTWLLTLHPTATGRIDAAYGAVYAGVALV
jgi:small multidrug resistance family-3 protein